MVKEYSFYWDRDIIEWRQKIDKARDEWHRKVDEEHQNHFDDFKLSESTVEIIVMSLAGVIVLIGLLVYFCCRRPTRRRGHVLASHPQQQYATVTVAAGVMPFGYPRATPYPAEIASCPATLTALPTAAAAASSAPSNNDQPPPYEQVVGQYPPCNSAIHPQ